ncbi:MAG: hypothetical protein L0214_07635 [candidate division NC10 bacterium]|nr:hypothetical protein [candidate division NC10 bacterium]
MAKSRRKKAAGWSRPKARPKPRRAAKPKPRRTKITKRRPAPSRRTPVTKPAQPELRIEEKVRYKDKRGRFVARGTKGARRHVYLYQLGKKGQVLRVIEQESPHLIVKTVVPSKIGDFEAEGKYQGLIFNALIDSSVTSELRKAKRVEVLIRWKDARGKAQREKLALDLGEVRKKRQFPAALAGLIIEALRDRGYRTNYTIELFKAARRKGLKYPITWEDWRKLVVARELEIIVTLYT